jgi:hypothetical protein
MDFLATNPIVKQQQKPYNNSEGIVAVLLKGNRTRRPISLSTYIQFFTPSFRALNQT